MRTLILAGAVLALGACSGGNQANNSSADNMAGGDTTMDANMTGDAGMMGDANMAGGNAMDSNGSVSAATGNGAADAHTKALMKKDAKTHDHDTNLANGI
jgi:hypothetical protein